MLRIAKRLLLIAPILLLSSGLVHAAAIDNDAAFTANTLAPNDDGSTGQVNIGFNANFFGTTYNSLWVNNNGNVTFNSAQSVYTPFGLVNATGNPIIAPFFADVDTRTDGSPVTYGTGTFGGHNAFGVDWLNVDYYQGNNGVFDNFQLLLVDRSDTGVGNFDIYFNYGSMKWETGNASGGSGGLGGASAHVGYSNGSGDAGTSYELPGSGSNGAFIDGGPNALNGDRLLFEVRNGGVTPQNPLPEPSTFALLGLGAMGLAIRAVRRRRQTTAS